MTLSQKLQRWIRLPRCWAIGRTKNSTKKSDDWSAWLQKPVYPVFFPVFSEFPRGDRFGWRPARNRVSGLRPAFGYIDSRSSRWAGVIFLARAGGKFRPERTYRFEPEASVVASRACW